MDLSGLDWYSPGTVYNDNGTTTNTSTGETTNWNTPPSSSSSSSNNKPELKYKSGETFDNSDGKTVEITVLVISINGKDYTVVVETTKENDIWENSTTQTTIFGEKANATFIQQNNFFTEMRDWALVTVDAAIHPDAHIHDSQDIKFGGALLTAAASMVWDLAFNKGIEALEGLEARLTAGKEFKTTFKGAKFEDPIIDKSKVKVNQGQQDKHIPGTNNYKQELTNGKPRSILTEDAQQLLDHYAGTGQKINDTKERVEFGKVIGQYYNPATGTYTDTTIGIITYGKNGAHIIPARPK